MIPWFRGRSHPSCPTSAAARLPRGSLTLLCACFALLLAGPASADETALDSQGLILAIVPAPGAEGVNARTGIELHLAAEPIIGLADDDPWWHLAGSISGPRLADECELAIEPRMDAAVYTLRLTTARPFLPGEEVRISLREGWPLLDGRQLPGLYASFRVAPAQLSGHSGSTTAADTESDDGRQILFEDVQRLEVGTGPNMAVAADFNRDGAVDLAVSEVLGDDSIDIFLNNSTGRLARYATLQVEGLSDPGRFAVADLNDDGLLDIAVIGQRSGNLVILRGDGEGGFATDALIDLEDETPVNVSVGDIDLDGHQDLLVTHLEGDSITLLRGDPESEVGFAAEERIHTLPDVQSLVMTDLDGNLLPDLAVISERTNSVGVLLARESASTAGDFDASIVVPTGHRPKAIVSGDVNGDGRTDLLVTQSGSNDVAVLVGRGDGTLEPPINHPVGDRPAFPALVDLNGDGNLDLAVPNLFSDEITLLLGTGDGHFETSESLPVDAGPVAVAAADFDNDGDIDLAVVNSVADNVTLYFSQQSELASGRRAPEPRSLHQNIPNPFNPSTTITYTLLKPSHVNLVVFNTSGKIVRTLADELHPAGQQSTFWDATNEAGENVPSGIYFYRLTTDETVELRRMTLIR